MAILFDCPRCSAAIQVPDEAVGKTGRCPSCQSKLRVPDVPPPPKRMIEFGCPRCSAAIRVPEEAAGKKGRCPQCQSKLLVPDPRATGMAAQVRTADSEGELATDASLPDLAQGMYSQAMPDLASLPSQPVHKPRKPRSSVGLIVTTLLSLTFCTVTWWMINQPDESLNGALVYERLSGFEFPPVAMQSDTFGLSRTQFKRMYDSLESRPLSLRSELSRIDVVARQNRIWLELYDGTRGAIYRVDPNKRGGLIKWIAKHLPKLNEPREEELVKRSSGLATALSRHSEGEGSMDSIAEYRDSVILANLTGGFGYHVAAIVGNVGYRCLYEDREGRLYFLLPAATRSFTLKGRSIGNDPPVFPGEIKMIPPRAADSRPKVDDAQDTPSPEEDSEPKSEKPDETGNDSGMSPDTSEEMSTEDAEAKSLEEGTDKADADEMETMHEPPKRKRKKKTAST